MRATLLQEQVWLERGGLAQDGLGAAARQSGPTVVRLVLNARGVEFYAGHNEGSRIVHLTAHWFLVEALCGETVHLEGEPDTAVVCDDCDRLGREAGGDPGEWVTEAVVRVELRAAA